MTFRKIKLKYNRHYPCTLSSQYNMDPWYERTGPSKADIQNSMQKSHIYICLHQESNITEENKFLCQIASNALSKEREKLNAYNYTQIRYERIREYPNWEKIAQQILKEEVISHKPYGSWRGFSTFVIGPLREKFIVRLIREIWAVQVIQTKFVPMWLAHNYCPTGEGYKRVSEHYSSLQLTR